MHWGTSGLLPDIPRMGPVSGAWQTLRSWSWGRGRIRGPSPEWGPQGEPYTTCPVWPEDVVLGKSPGPRHGSGVGTWRAAQDRLKDWPARWEPRNLHLAPRTLLVVQSGTGTHCKACPADCLEHWKAAPFAGWVLGCLACPHPSRLRLCSSQERKKGTQAHSRASGMLPDGSSHPRWVRGLGEAGPSTCLSRANLGTRGVHTPQQSPTLLLCWQKNQLFFTRHKACASNAMFTPKPFGSGRKKTCLFKKKQTTNTKPPLGNATDSRGPEQTL